MPTKKRKAYEKSYYKENKERIKITSREKYAELKAKNITRAVADKNSGGFFTIATQQNRNKVSANNILSQFVSWIFTCATLNASSISSQDLHLYATTSEGQSSKFLHKTKSVNKSELKSLARIRRAENVVEVVDHPVLDLLENVNPFNNNFETFELTQIYLDMVGDSYWYIIKDGLDIPSEIWVLQSQWMKILPGKSLKRFIKGYVYGRPDNLGRTNNLVKFQPKEIIHFKTPNPLSQYHGRGVAQSVISAINRLNSMDQTEQSRLDNNGRPDFVVNYKGKLDSSEIKKIERMWNSAFGGADKAGKIKVMDEDFSLETLGFSPKDMEYLNGRVWSLKEIAAAFNIPYSILDTSDAKKATSEMANYWYSKNAILPRITRIAEKLTEKLLPMYDSSGRLFFQYDSPIPEDRELMLKENTGYVAAGIISVNEARLKLGMEKLENEKFDTPKGGGEMPDMTPNPDKDDEETEEEEEK